MDHDASEDIISDNIPVRDIRHANWFWLNNSIIDEYAAVLTPIGIAIYAYLARRANRESTAFPSLGTIATALNLSKSSVAKYLDVLESVALIKRVRRRSPDSGHLPTQYLLLTLPERPQTATTHGVQPCSLGEQGCTSSGHNQYQEIKTKITRQEKEEEKTSMSSGEDYVAVNPQILPEKILRHDERVIVDDPPLPMAIPSSPSATLEEGTHPLTPSHLIDMYNTLTPATHPKIKRKSPGRLDLAKQYLKAFPERSFWETVFANISTSPFLQGQKNGHGHTSFVADFEWLLSKGKDKRIENCLKVAEGVYSEKGGGTQTHTPATDHQGFTTYFRTTFS